LSIFTENHAQLDITLIRTVKMIAHLTRLNYFHNGILGSMTIGECKFYIGEHAYENRNGTFLPKVPKGQYTCKRGIHQLPGHLNSFETFELENVPGHTGILIHIGNFPQTDSQGCLLIGKGIIIEEPSPQITQSKIGFNEFMHLLDGHDSFELVIS